MNRRAIYVTIIFLIGLGSRPSVAQYVCANNQFGNPEIFLPNSGCVIGGTVIASDSFTTRLTAVEPQLYQSRGSQNVILSGIMSGDLGTKCGPPQCAAPVTSFSCQPFTIGPSFKVGPLAIATSYSPGAHIVTATFTTCESPIQTWSGTIIINAVSARPTSNPCFPNFVDPVDAQLTRGLFSGTTKIGTYITDQRAILQNAASVVSGVSADGVAEVVVRVPTNRAGDHVSVSLTNGRGSIDDDGGLLDVDDQQGSLSNTLNLVASGSPPMAFAIYRAPQDFDGTGLDDNATNRRVVLQVSCPDTNGALVTTGTPIIVVRPPVELVHGLWSKPADWDSFNPLATPDPSLGDSRFFVRRADFSNLVSGITATTPAYSASAMQNIRQSALGFAYNAPILFDHIQAEISDFKNRFNVAAVQVDAVGHSMGGNITRTMPLLPNFANDANYSMGPVHKLITIGTPHLGTPLATQLLQGNECVRKALATADLVSLQSATLSGNLVDGAVGDLQGDGFGGALSSALTNAPPHPQFASAYVAGTVTSRNLSNVGMTAKGILLRSCRVFFDTLAEDLNSADWRSLFGQDSDAIVPLVSQLNNTTGLTSVGVIHGPSIESLGFSGPSELDQPTDIPAKVIMLLNESVSGSDFHR